MTYGYGDETKGQEHGRHATMQTYFATMIVPSTAGDVRDRGRDILNDREGHERRGDKAGSRIGNRPGN